MNELSPRNAESPEPPIPIPSEPAADAIDEDLGFRNRTFPVIESPKQMFVLETPRPPAEYDDDVDALPPRPQEPADIKFQPGETFHQREHRERETAIARVLYWRTLAAWQEDVERIQATKEYRRRKEFFDNGHSQGLSKSQIAKQWNALREAEQREEEFMEAERQRKVAERRRRLAENPPSWPE